MRRNNPRRYPLRKNGPIIFGPDYDPDGQTDETYDVHRTRSLMKFFMIFILSAFILPLILMLNLTQRMIDRIAEKRRIEEEFYDQMYQQHLDEQKRRRDLGFD